MYINRSDIEGNSPKLAIIRTHIFTVRHGLREFQTCLKFSPSFAVLKLLVRDSYRYRSVLVAIIAIDRRYSPWIPPRIELRLCYDMSTNTGELLTSCCDTSTRCLRSLASYRDLFTNYEEICTSTYGNATSLTRYCMWLVEYQYQ